MSRKISSKVLRASTAVASKLVRQIFSSTTEPQSARPTILAQPLEPRVMLTTVQLTPGVDDTVVVTEQASTVDISVTNSSGTTTTSVNKANFTDLTIAGETGSSTTGHDDVLIVGDGLSFVVHNDSAATNSDTLQFRAASGSITVSDAEYFDHLVIASDSQLHVPASAQLSGNALDVSGHYLQAGGAVQFNTFNAAGAGSDPQHGIINIAGGTVSASTADWGGSISHVDVTQSGGSISVGTLHLGDYATATSTMNQIGGAFSATDFWMGYYGHASWHMTTGATLTAAGEHIGNWGYATFDNDGGTNNGGFELGPWGGHAIYNQTAGSSVGGAGVGWWNGNGTINLSGGTFSGGLWLGGWSDNSWGSGNIGTFNQSGGTADFRGNQVVLGYTGGHGVYNLSNGLMQADDLIMGFAQNGVDEGVAEIHHTGGREDLAGSVVYDANPYNGTYPAPILQIYHLSAGELHTTRDDAIDASQLDFTGGTWTTGLLHDMSSIVAQSLIAGESLTVTSHFSNDDLDQNYGDSVINWGDGTTGPTVVTADSGSTMAASATHVYGVAGLYHALLKVEDTNGGFAEAAFEVSVNGAMPTFTGSTHASGIDFNAIAGQTFSGNVAHFTSSLPTSSILSIVPSVEWGDDTESNGTVVSDNLGGYFVTASHLYSQPDIAPVITLIPDGTDEPATALSTATVIDPGPSNLAVTYSLNPDASYITLHATAQDPAGEDTLTYTWSLQSNNEDVEFTDNGSNDSKNTSAYLTAAKSLTFSIIAANSDGHTASNQITVVVPQIMTGLQFVDSTIDLDPGASAVVSATAVDQFGNDMQQQPPITYTLNAGAQCTITNNTVSAPQFNKFNESDQLTASTTLNSKTYRAIAEVVYSNSQYNGMSLQVSHPSWNSTLITSALPSGNYEYMVPDAYILFLQKQFGSAITGYMLSPSPYDGLSFYTTTNGIYTFTLYQYKSQKLTVVDSQSISITDRDPFVGGHFGDVYSLGLSPRNEGGKLYQDFVYQSLVAGGLQLQESIDDGQTWTNKDTLQASVGLNTYTLDDPSTASENVCYRILYNGADETGRIYDNPPNTGFTQYNFPAGKGFPATPTLTSATPNPNTGLVTLQWAWNFASSAGYTSPSTFELQWSPDGQSYDSIGTFDGTVRTCQTPLQQYGTNYYRIVAARDIRNSTSQPTYALYSRPSNAISFSVPALPVAVDDVSGGAINEIGTPERYFIHFGHSKSWASDVGVLANDIKPADATASLIGNVANALVTLLPDGGFSVFPAAGYRGTISFTYQILSAAGNSKPATVRIAVGNPPIVPKDDSFSISAGGSLNQSFSTLAQNDGIPAGVNAEFQLVSGVRHGRLTWNASGFQYQANPGYGGFDFITYQVKDGSTLSPYATVRIQIAGAPPAPKFRAETFDNNLAGLEASYNASVTRAVQVLHALRDYGDLVTQLTTETEDSDAARALVDSIPVKIESINTSYERYVKQLASTMTAAGRLLQDSATTATLAWDSFWEHDDLHQVVSEIQALPSDIGYLRANRDQAQQLLAASHVFNDGSAVLLSNATAALESAQATHDTLNAVSAGLSFGTASLAGLAIGRAAWSASTMIPFCIGAAKKIVPIASSAVALYLLTPKLESLAADHGYDPQKVRIALEAIQLGFFVAGAAARKYGDCFTGDTKILTQAADGTSVYKRIDQLEDGDKVTTCDTVGNLSMGIGVVSQLTHHSVNALTELTYESSDGVNGQLRSTPDHLYYVLDKGWIRAADLAVGNRLESSTGEVITVAEAKGLDFPDGIEVYNFDVEGPHDYFVGDGVVPAALVHNDCSSEGYVDDLKKNYPRRDIPADIAGDKDRVTNFHIENNTGRVVNNSIGGDSRLGNMTRVEAWDKQRPGSTKRPDYKIHLSDQSEVFADCYTPKNAKTFINNIFATLSEKSGEQTDGGIVFVQTLYVDLDPAAIVKNVAESCVLEDGSKLPLKMVVVLKNDSIIGVWKP